MIAVGARYAWMIRNIFKNGPPKTELEITLEEQSSEKRNVP